MSSYLTTTQMVEELKTKVPFGYTDAFLLARIANAYSWIVQKGPYKFQRTYANLNLPAATLVVNAPTDFNEGGPATILGPDGTQVKYLPLEEFLLQKQVTPFIGTAATGDSPLLFAWTFYRTGSGSVTTRIEFAGQLPPAGGAGATLFYHFNPTLTLSMGTYLPTPSEFDVTIMMKAEAEIRFLYGLAGFSERVQETEKTADFLAARYRSTAKDLAGMVEIMRKAQETQAQRTMA